ncbi:sensor histidine kinase [Streptomyces sp. NPDC058867]|uniref:sensor histidine kinase n=1 Tax=unclassified Streptomyces TaxID=2593676 RepID=UPI0036C76CE3
MTPDHADCPAAPARGTVPSPSPGPEAGWGSPLLNRFLRRDARLRQLDQRHPWLLDSAVVLAITAFSLPDLLTGGAPAPFGESDARDHLPTALPYILSAALIAPLWWRRRAPTAVFFVIMAVSLIQAGVGIWLPAGVSALVALYTLALHGSLRVLGWAVGLAVAQLLVTVLFLMPVERWLLGTFFLLGTLTAATTLGLMLRIRRMYMSALEDRARRLEIERDQRVRLTAAAERSRVAREMHDIVGHNLSVMVTLADGAAALAARNNERSAEALRILGDTGRQAMGELRRVLGALREDPTTVDRRLSPQPGIADLDALLARVRAAGLPVTYRISGDPGPLGSGVELTVYRIVQEALTNTLKHAGPQSPAEVTLAIAEDGVRVRVIDSGTSPDAPARPTTEPSEDDPGHGLVGIRQRAALYGGAVTIGPRADRPGWVVDVLLNASTSAPPSTPGGLRT